MAQLTIIAGVNGAGKSTIAGHSAALPLLGGTPAINPDTFTRQVEQKHGFSGDPANLCGVLQAELDAWKAIAEGKSVAVETVLSTDKYLSMVRAASMRNYRTVLLYIGLPSVELALERIATRVKAGGHAVPDVKVRERWPRSLANFVQFLPEMDDVLLFTNARTEPDLVGERRDRGIFKLFLADELPEITRLLVAAGFVKT